jgi:5-methylcytosine-specific restriction enzyme subunit McrC
MRTDVTLRGKGRTIVMDAKFYKTTLKSYRGGPERIRPGHLYQLLTYLHHTDRESGSPSRSEGILLYPRTGSDDLRLDYAIAGHRVRVHTVALNRPWPEIKHDLLNLLT